MDDVRWYSKVFFETLPDTRATGGEEALTRQGWQDLKAECQMLQKEDFAKHLLNLHDGEARLVGDRSWLEVWSNGLNHTRFWHCQTMRSAENFNWCWRSHGGGQDNPDLRERFL